MDRRSGVCRRARDSRSGWRGARARPGRRRGARVDLGIARAPNAKLAYVTPAHHAPLGVTLPADRRLALLDWAEAMRAWIVEDDYDSEFRYESRPVAALAALDRHGVVIHTGSFSKTMVPGLRLAYVVAPEALVSRFVAAKSVLDRFTPPLLQEALAEFIHEGHFARHLRRMRELYAERRTALLEAIADELPAIEVVGAEAGIDVVARLPPGVDDQAAALALEKAGLDAMPLSDNAIRPLARGGLILGFAGFTPAKLRTAVSAMKRALAPLLPPVRRPRRAGSMATRHRAT
ncbi:Transcriptional regulator, GntR family domain / Aspartate aminotransferase [Labilithrix luteola]|uniref:Transcriptional regulator, GntR family domain / Aspartate aminotransferase n=1 Tax=Labilithrix luteola TaxID=1391654 RepID=A0A0K1QBE9_9BACT|nr:PLP-dependent aminotransferase family protein [Labilithrix luteola]AKV02997.1 Transcriptional regulator, GntR family domain / Aspartate aminotransferase [Labilithrix luteola]